MALMPIRNTIIATAAVVTAAAIAVPVTAALLSSDSSAPVVRDATNTGPPANTVFTTRAGNFNVTAAGTTLENVDISGGVGILADNVTLRNCRIHGEARIGRSITGGGDKTVTGTTIQNCEFIGNGGLEGVNDVTGVNTIIKLNNLHGYQNCVTIWTGTADQLLDNYCHGEQSSSTGAHYDGFEIYGIRNGITIRGNHVTQTVSAGATAPLNLTPTTHFDGQVIVDTNLLQSANCAYVILADDSQGTTPINATITNNQLIAAGSSCSPWSLRTSHGSTYALSGNTISKDGGNTFTTIPGQSTSTTIAPGTTTPAPTTTTTAAPTTTTTAAPATTTTSTSTTVPPTTTTTERQTIVCTSPPLVCTVT